MFTGNSNTINTQRPIDLLGLSSQQLDQLVSNLPDSRSRQESGKTRNLHDSQKASQVNALFHSKKGITLQFGTESIAEQVDEQPAPEFATVQPGVEFASIEQPDANSKPPADPNPLTPEEMHHIENMLNDQVAMGKISKEEAQEILKELPELANKDGQRDSKGALRIGPFGADQFMTLLLEAVEDIDKDQPGTHLSASDIDKIGEKLGLDIAHPPDGESAEDIVKQDVADFEKQNASTNSTKDFVNTQPAFDPEPTAEQEKEIRDRMGDYVYLDGYLVGYTRQNVIDVTEYEIKAIEKQEGRTLSEKEVKELTDDAINDLHVDGAEAFKNQAMQGKLGVEGVEQQIFDKWTGTTPPPSPLSPAEEQAIQKYAAQYGVDPNELRNAIEEIDKKANDSAKQQAAADPTDPGKKIDWSLQCQAYMISNVAGVLKNDPAGLPDMINAQASMLLVMAHLAPLD